MNKSIQNGDLLIIKKCSNYKVGDVICFVENGQVISHRIVEFNQDKIITKGDNNASFDQPISKNQICGKVVLISGVLGKVFCFFPIILLGIFIVSILMKIVKF